MLLLCSVPLSCLLFISAPDEQAFGSWQASGPVLAARGEPWFDSVAVKDPSVVCFEGTWHVFYTARGRDEYSIGTVSARNLDALHEAKRHKLDQLSGTHSAYAAAPQVFYFAPQRTWYLVFQTRDSNYQPVYSTTQTIENPESWSAPLPLVEKSEDAKWIDFWVICDEETAYLFYTRSHQDVYIMTTRLEDFPRGFTAPSKVFSPVHEAVHVYRATGAAHPYWMIYELGPGLRRFGLAVADRLSGPWTGVTDSFATGEQLRFENPDSRWTDEVSHGECLRAGCDQDMAINPGGLEILIQGMPEKQHQGAYTSLPWRLGLIRSEVNRVPRESPPE